MLNSYKESLIMPEPKHTKATQPPNPEHVKVHEELEAQTLKKAFDLLRATQALTAQVGSLTIVVEANNEQIRKLRKEVDQKPDDSEVQAIAGFSHLERVRHMRFAVGISMLCAVLAATISFTVVNHLSKQRCQANSRQTETLVTLLSRFDVTKKNDVIQGAIQQLNSDKVEC